MKKNDISSAIIVRPKTTARSRTVLLICLVFLLLQIACSRSQTALSKPEEEALSRTEFTERIENYFEYEPLKAGKQSQFLIHLTDLSDGTPIETAEVTIFVRSKGSASEVTQTKAKVGKVTGIYVAELTIPAKGEYDLEFHVQNQKVNERLPLTDFKVE